MPDNSREVVYFGRIDFRGANRVFGIKRADRRQHMYVIGKTGTGKTTLIKNMIIQDISNGEGLAVVDPHGELVEEVLAKIPKSRLKDVIYFNPADPDYHIGFNILEVPDPRYKNLVASGLMGIFTKIWAGVWSARMEYILSNCVLALMDTPNTTLLGITRLLVDKEYRAQIVGNIKDPVVRGFWVNEYEQWRDQFRNEAIVPIQNKVGQFLSTALVRNIVGQSKSTISLDEIMNSGKILLVNVSKGRIGEDNSRLLGAMIITKLQPHAMERVRIKDENERLDFYLYVDEFQNFATDSFANISSEARKYRLNLIMAHQYVGQLTDDQSTKVRDAVFGNVGTMVAFRVGASDAEFLEKEFTPEFDVQDLINLPNRSIYLKLMVDGVTSRPFSSATLPPFTAPGEAALMEEIVAESRKRYSRNRLAVEEEISQWSGGGMAQQEEDRGGNTSSLKSSAMEGVPERPRPKYSVEVLAQMGIEFEPRFNKPSLFGKETPPISSNGGGAPGRSERRPGFERRPDRPGQAGFPARNRSAPISSNRPRFIVEEDAKTEDKDLDVGASLSALLKPKEDKNPPKKEKIIPTGGGVDLQDIKNSIRASLGGLSKDKNDGEKKDN